MKSMSSIVSKKLKITLRSDLVCGSGEGWGNLVDRDIVYDDYGFPYIPARRIKGLLKEALWELEQFQVEGIPTSEEMFGNEENEGHHFTLYNAQLENIKEMRKEIDCLNLNSGDVLSHYTTIRYQTSIDEQGIAKKNSLRSTRAIKRGNMFYAYMECEESDLDLLQKCCSLVKHMGSSRSRGFGEVLFEIIDAKDSNQNSLVNLVDEKEYVVTLKLKNNTQLALSSTKGEKGLDYISGSSILGYFANRYLKNHEVDNKFYDLFINGNLFFDNAYISDEEFNEYIPVRESLYRQKTGKTYFDKIVYDQNKITEILKKVRGKYCLKSNEHALIQEVEREMYYHHRRPSDKTIGHPIQNGAIEDGAFYQLEVIRANQHFISKIHGKGVELKHILSDLPQYIQIGKSKSTQYGNVEVCDIEIKEKDLKYCKGEVVCTLLSPTIILNDYQEADVNTETIIKAIGLDANRPISCFMGYTEIGGYNAKWKLQKPSYHAFSQGSCFRGFLTKELREEIRIGELTNEGNGLVYIQSVDELKLDTFICETKEMSKEKVKAIYTKPIYITYLKQQLFLDLLAEIQIIGKPKFSNSYLNRLLKMLESYSISSMKAELNTVQNSKVELKDKCKDALIVIDKIEMICNEGIGKSELKSYLTKDERECYFKEIVVTMLKEYLKNHKRGDE